MKDPRGTFASLSSSLLARKGHARPAMRPNSGQSLEDLGWNDHGHDAEESIEAMAQEPAPIRYQAAITAKFSRPEELVNASPSSQATAVEPDTDANHFAAKERVDETAQVEAPAIAIRRRVKKSASAPLQAAAKAAFTLRLDERRHLRLRLACAMLNRSGQQLVAEALDQYLDGVTGLEELARRMPDKEITGHN